MAKVKTRPYQPRPYQLECINALAQARAEGTKAGLVEMASGLGKTLTVIFDLEQYLMEYPDARVLYVCDQEPILVQSKEKFRQYFSDERSYGMFTGSDKTYHRVDFLFATFQSLKEHPEAFAVDTFDYIVNDEAHHAMAPTYKPVLQRFQPNFLLGLTATPDRGDGLDILEIYQKIIFRMTIYDGWVQKWLAQVDYRLMLDELNEQELKRYIEVPDSEGMKVSLAQLNRTVFVPQRDEEIVRTIREQTADILDPKICIYCSNITHAESIARCFAGEAALVHSKQSRDLNAAILTEFRAGNIRTLISVDMLNEGYDVPQANVVVFLRSTESLRIFLQQLGRGLRLIADKEVVRVLDFAINIERISMVIKMEKRVQEHLATIRPTIAGVPVEPFQLNIRATKFRMERVDIEKILLMVRHRWTKEDIKRAALELAADLGRDLTIYDFRDNPRLPSDTLVYDQFGSWPNFCAEVGFECCRGSTREWTPETVKRAILAYAKDGVMPLATEFNRNPELPHWSTVMLHIAPSMPEVCKVLGLATPSTRSKTDREILSEYHALAKKNGTWPSSRQLNDNPAMCSDSTLRNRFDNVENARKLAIELFGPITRKRYNGPTLDLQLITVLQQAVRNCGHRLRHKDLGKPNGLPSKTYFEKRGINIHLLNELIGADEILATLENS